MFTTAGSTRLTIPAKELDAGIGSGTVRGVAVVPENPRLFIAETRPETTEPIKIPTVSVNATNTAASILRRRAQSKSSLTCSPMLVTPLFQAPAVLLASVDGSSACPDPIGAQPRKYNTATPMALLLGKRLGEAITVPVAGGAFRFLFSILLDAGNPKFVVNAGGSTTRVGVNIGSSTTKLRKRLGRAVVNTPPLFASYFNDRHW